MVELVPASDTLRKIQVEYGVTGSFKDKPLAEWLRKYNPTEEEYEKVSFFTIVLFGRSLKRDKYHIMKEFFFQIFHLSFCFTSLQNLIFSSTWKRSKRKFIL